MQGCQDTVTDAWQLTIVQSGSRSIWAIHASATCTYETNNDCHKIAADHNSRIFHAITATGTTQVYAQCVLKVH